MKSNLHIASGTAMAIALSSALTIAVNPVSAQGADKEKCFGISMQGKNDCAAGPGTSCAGTAKADFQGSIWRYVAKGTCEKVESPSSETGFGQLKPFKEKS